MFARNMQTLTLRRRSGSCSILSKQRIRWKRKVRLLWIYHTWVAWAQGFPSHRWVSESSHSSISALSHCLFGVAIMFSHCFFMKTVVSSTKKSQHGVAPERTIIISIVLQHWLSTFHLHLEFLSMLPAMQKDRYYGNRAEGLVTL